MAELSQVWLGLDSQEILQFFIYLFIYSRIENLVIRDYLKKFHHKNKNSKVQRRKKNTT